jgi:hypothetical protein
MEKRFKHDCEDCVFLGQHNEFDLYFCPSPSLHSTVIARYSSEGSDYHSGVEFAYSGKIPQLIEALNRSVDRKLFELPVYNLTVTNIHDMFLDNKNETMEEYLLETYKLVYEKIQKGLWQNISSVEGYPKVSLNTTKYILQQMKKALPDQSQRVMMLWLNNGFSTDEQMEDWKVKPAPFRIIS